MNIRPADLHDELRISQLICESIDAHLRELTIWRSPQIAEYVRDLIQFSQNDVFYVAEAAMGALIGVVHYRKLGDQAFLNHIFVDTKLRGTGVGTRLLYEATAAFLNDRDFETVALDARKGAPAESWYSALGFRTVSDVVWQTLRLSPQKERPGAVVLLPGALESMARYHFCRFIVDTGPCRYDIGQLGEQYFNVQEPESWRDPVLHATLNAISPDARLIIRSENLLPGAQINYRSVRMSTDCKSFLQLLQSSSDKGELHSPLRQ
jgi:GNAT superfamily N-acetyltransferase